MRPTHRIVDGKLVPVSASFQDVEVKAKEQPTTDDPGMGGFLTGQLSTYETRMVAAAAGVKNVHIKTHKELEARGLTFEKKTLKPPMVKKPDPSTVKQDMIENMKNAQANIPKDWLEKMKKGWRLDADKDGKLLLTPPPEKPKDAGVKRNEDLLPEEPDGVDALAEDEEVPGYNENEPVIDMAFLELKAKRDAEDRYTDRKRAARRKV